MIRAFVFGVLTAIVLALVGGYLVLRNGIIPANADATPTWLETWAAETSLDATLSREAQGTNPVTLTDKISLPPSNFTGSTARSATARRREIRRPRRLRRAFTRSLRNWRQTAWKTIPKPSLFGRSSMASGGPECRHGRGPSPTGKSGPLL